MDIGRRFKHYREEMGLSQKDAAELIGVKYYQLGNYETNRSEPSISVLKKMSQVYEVSIDQLVGNFKYKNPINKDQQEEMDQVFKVLNELVDKYNNNY